MSLTYDPKENLYLTTVDGDRPAPGSASIGAKLYETISGKKYITYDGTKWVDVTDDLIATVGIDQTTPGTTNKVTAEGIAMSEYDSTPAQSSGVIKASAGRMYGVIVTNNSASDQYIQFFNLTAVPADTAVPDLVPAILVPAGEIASIDFGFHGKAFPVGICWSNSSTQATKTIGAADCWLTAIYK